jgi:hypothetical protein
MTKRWREGSRKEFARFVLFLSRYVVPVGVAIGAATWIYQRTW